MGIRRRGNARKGQACTLYLDKEQVKWLKNVAEYNGRSVSQLVGIAIDEFQKVIERDDLKEVQNG